MSNDQAQSVEEAAKELRWVKASEYVAGTNYEVFIKGCRIDKGLLCEQEGYIWLFRKTPFGDLETITKWIVGHKELNEVEWLEECDIPPSLPDDVSDTDEKEVMIQAFDKVRKMFEFRSWIMEGRGSYRYDDDRYKEEVRYLYDEFDALQKDTWKNIKSKSFEYRNRIEAPLKDENKRLREALKKIIECVNEPCKLLEHLDKFKNIAEIASNALK